MVLNNFQASWLHPSTIASLLLFFFHIHGATAQNYDSLTQSIEQARVEFHTAYQTAHAPTQDSIVQQATAYLENMLAKEIFPAWYGTPWDYNGMSRTPRKGSIACGFFVTNVLTDIGYHIPRIKWAQSASEVFIRKLCPAPKRFYQKPASTVESFLKKSGDGIYLVGLDYHTGFITVNQGEVRFVHSNYYQADIGVMSEPILSENPLTDSRYRVIGKLFSEEMVKNWLSRTAY